MADGFEADRAKIIDTLIKVSLAAKSTAGGQRLTTQTMPIGEQEQRDAAQIRLSNSLQLG